MLLVAADVASQEERQAGFMVMLYCISFFTDRMVSRTEDGADGQTKRRYMWRTDNSLNVWLQMNRQEHGLGSMDRRLEYDDDDR